MMIRNSGLSNFCERIDGSFSTLMHHERRVAAVVNDEVGTAAVGPGEGLFGAPPVLLKGLALPGEHRGRTGLRDRRRRMVLRRKDIARCPADIGAQLLERLDKHGRLYGHVQASGDLEALERFLRAVLFAHRHQAGHFVFR